MLSRISTTAFRATSRLSAPAAPVAQVTKRFASDKAIRTRMVAVGNIKKITKAMKMVASAKLRRSEEALTIARNFARSSENLFPSVAPAARVESSPVENAAPVNSHLVVAITPDRGLCGSVSATISRAARARLNALAKTEKQVSLLTLGEKVRASLQRAYNRQYVEAISEHSKLKRRTFKQTSILADEILAQKFESGELIYNQFKNLITFESTTIPLLSYAQAIADPKHFEAYEIEGEADVLENLYEYTFAIRLGQYLAECDMVEFSQRVNSMGNSSKSAEDMLSRLKLLYNRTRQAKITTELCEIISGATAADDGAKKD